MAWPYVARCGSRLLLPWQSVRNATYLRYGSSDSATRAFEAATVNDIGRPCAEFRDGVGVIKGRDGNYRIICSYVSDGTPHFAWLDESARHWGYANGKTLKALIDWWRSDG